MSKAARSLLAISLVSISLIIAEEIAVTSVQPIVSRYCRAPLQGMHIFGTWIGRPGTFFALKRQCNFVAPGRFQRGFGIILIGGAVGAFLCLGLGFLGAKVKLRQGLFGSAKWASVKEIKKLGLLQDEGIFLGKLPDGRFLRHEGPEHYAVIAPTRSGKGAGVVVPTLLTWPGSAFVYDLKEENWKKTAGARSKFSDVIYFNPSSRYSAHFNPLLSIRPGLSEVRDVQNLANMIIEPERAGMSDHWIRTGNALLTAAILHVLYTSPPEEKNLAGVTAFLSRGDKNLRDTLHEMMETKHLRDPNDPEGKTLLGPHPGIVSSARDVLTKSPDDMSSVHSTIMGYLSLYRDPLLAHNTRESDFTIEDLVSREKPVTLYFVVPHSDIERLRPLIRLMVNQICRRLTEPEHLGENSQDKHRLLFMLDEFPALGRLEFFETALGFIAGYGLKSVLICQSMNQLKATYGERSSLLDNTHVRAYFRPNTNETAKYISESLGEETVDYETDAHSGRIGSPFYVGKSKTKHLSKRALLTLREVMELGDDEAVLFVGGSRPIRCKKIAYWNDEVFKNLHSEAPVIGEESAFGFARRGESPWFAAIYIGKDEENMPMPEAGEQGSTKKEEAQEGVLVVEGKKETNPAPEQEGAQAPVQLSFDNCSLQKKEPKEQDLIIESKNVSSPVLQQEEAEADVKQSTDDEDFA